MQAETRLCLRHYVELSELFRVHLANFSPRKDGDQALNCRAPDCLSRGLDVHHHHETPQDLIVVAVVKEHGSHAWWAVRYCTNGVRIRHRCVGECSLGAGRQRYRSIYHVGDVRWASLRGPYASIGSILVTRRRRLVQILKRCCTCVVRVCWCFVLCGWLGCDVSIVKTPSSTCAGWPFSSLTRAALIRWAQNAGVHSIFPGGAAQLSCPSSIVASAESAVVNFRVRTDAAGPIAAASVPCD